MIEQTSFHVENGKAEQNGPVECLGMTFENDTARREYFLDKLREKLRDPEFRQIEGFPIGSDDDILALSDPPYYTACPNPFIPEFITSYATPYDPVIPYSKSPYTGELESSTRHPVYSFHPYHTKVPLEIIRHLIEHYTEPNDIILDGFSGSGMTGAAAREAGRYGILSDLSPIAAFVSGANVISHDAAEAVAVLSDIIVASERLYGHLYTTKENGKIIPVNYFVWSDVFTCPECVCEFPFFPYGVIHHGNKVETRDSFPCPSCGLELNVRRVERILLPGGKKKALAWVNAGTGRLRINREPNSYDLDLVQKIEATEPSAWYPVDSIDPNGYSAKLAQLGDKAITDVSRFLSRRNLIIFTDLWDRVSRIEDAGIRHVCRATLTSIYTVISERQGYFGGGGGMSGNLYMPIVRMEKNIYDSVRRKLGKLKAAENAKQDLSTDVIVSTQSTTKLNSIPSSSIDYIYTDPPFGANIIYSEMNLVLEAWLRIKTNGRDEAVIDETRTRDFNEYAMLMRECFHEYYRVLKPGRWITIEFHNTLASIWNLIQTAIGESGLIVAQVSVFDKGSTTILADIRPGAAKHDLIISAYKPTSNLEEQFRLVAGTERGVWDFVRSHLNQLPVFLTSKDGLIDVITERTSHLLFDRMVSFHVQHGVAVPLSASEFYKGLTQRFPERDSMFFLPEQVAEYERKRMTVREVQQLHIMVTDEASAIQWIRQQLTKKPQTTGELTPQFMQELGTWEKHEVQLELSTLLEENFLRYTGEGLVPAQIIAWMKKSSELRELIQREGRELENGSLETNNPVLIVRAKDRWYVPDPNKAIDLEKLRLKGLLREFATYVAGKGRLKQFRTEAVRTGFAEAWRNKDYTMIVRLAERLPENVLQEDPDLLMYYDNASLRVG